MCFGIKVLLLQSRDRVARVASEVLLAAFLVPRTVRFSRCRHKEPPLKERNNT